MKNFNKALVGTAAAAAMAVSATPAMARDRHDDGIGAGEIIAGALIIGGIAAIASASNNNRDRYAYDRAGYRGDYRYYNGYRDNYRQRDGSRRAVNQCIRAAENEAARYGGRANVTEIRDIDRKRYGYRVKGNIVVADGYNGYRGHRNYRGRGYYDNGSFTCYTDRGRVSDVRLKGLGNYR